MSLRSAYYRNLTGDGRVTIPYKIRKKLGLEFYEPLEVTIDGDRIIIRRVGA